MRGGRYLQPNDVIDHVSELDLAFLRERHLRGLVLDLDNTLIPYGSYDEAGEKEREMAEWAGELRRAGVGLYLLSNATGKRAEFWSTRLGLSGVGMAGKPNPRAFIRALEALGLPAYQVGMVGDQLFTDVLGGNLSGMHTILVRPLATNSLPHTKLARRLERAVLRRFGHDWQA